MRDLGRSVDLAVDFDTAVDRVTEALAQEGFGVLTRIDVDDAFRKKLGVEFRRYAILGACNPKLAHKALSAAPEVGLLLPCNVLVREDSDGKVHVDFMDPASVMSLVDNPGVAPLAAEVKQKLERACEAL